MGFRLPDSEFGQNPESNSCLWGEREMNKGRVGFIVAVSAFVLLALVASLALFATGSQAAAPNRELPAAPAAPAPGAAQAPAAPKPQQPSAPSASSWVDI